VAFEARLVLYLYGMLLTYFNRKVYLRHRAVSLRQHGFLVKFALVLELRSDHGN